MVVKTLILVALLFLSACSAPIRKTQPSEVDANYGAGKKPEVDAAGWHQ